MNGYPCSHPVARCRTSLCLFFLVALACFADTARSAAGPPPVHRSPVAASVFADSDGWGVRKLIGRMSTRDNSIRIAICCMGVALFIVMFGMRR